MSLGANSKYVFPFPGYLGTNASLAGFSYITCPHKQALAEFLVSNIPPFTIFPDDFSAFLLLPKWRM